MDFMKNIYFAPNHGDGSLGATILTAVVAIITGIAIGFFHRDKVDMRKQTDRN